MSVVLLTGGGSGLGRALADSFAAEGVSVAVLERSADKAADVVAATGCVAVVGDVRSPDDCRRAVADTVARYGRLDAVVACAAITDRFVPICEIPDAQFLPAVDEVFGVNVVGCMNMARAAVSPLRATRGAIVLTLSTSALFAGGGGPLYTVSKHACVGVVRQLAWELAPDIRVNGIVPGAIADSDIRGPAALGEQDLSPGMARNDLATSYPPTVPLGVLPRAADYFPIYRLLVSEQNRLATGAIFNWDAGVGMVGHGYRSPGEAL
jgi:NAD(P)-dependent dehydrogenase (short-subunit alcohol dehydrogenase family)